MKVLSRHDAVRKYKCIYARPHGEMRYYVCLRTGEEIALKTCAACAMREEPRLHLRVESQKHKKIRCSSPCVGSVAGRSWPLRSELAFQR